MLKFNDHLEAFKFQWVKRDGCISPATNETFNSCERLWMLDAKKIKTRIAIFAKTETRIVNFPYLQAKHVIIKLAYNYP